MEMIAEIVGVDDLDLNAFENLSLPTRLFSMLDRCDRCGFQAYYVVQKNTSELCFCKHHGEEFSGLLVLGGWKINNFTSELDAKNVLESTKS